MKNAKRLFTLALALMMILSLAVPTLAAEGDYTITITNSDSISSAGHVYTAYQIFSGTLDSTGTILSDIQWGVNLPAENAAAFVAALQADTTLGEGTANLFYGKSEARDIAAILALPANHTSTVIEAFAKAATANVTGDPVSTSSEDDAPYTITIPAAQPGYYLVKDALATGVSNVNKDISDYILQVVGDVSVEHKGSIPTMDKQVSETGDTYHDSIHTGINETHYYRIVAELPDDYYLYDEYYLEFSDNMSKGLTFDAIEKVYAIIRSSNTPVVIPLDNDSDEDCEGYTLATNSIATNETVMPGGTHMSVVINDLKSAVPNLTADDAVVIVYKAHVNSDAVIGGSGIPNQATIIYSNNPNTNGHGESTPDETNVYPINLNIVKVDGKNKTAKLAGAQFVLMRTHATNDETYFEYAVLDKDKKISKWAHHYEGDGCEAGAHTAATELGTILTTDENGSINVIGLDPGRYDLKEIEAPDGYNALTENVIITASITVDETTDEVATMTGTTNQGAITFDASTATVTITIDNFKGDVLPSTGGVGTTMFYIFGGLMVAAAVVLLVTKKRMTAQN